jgi:hypothetical protein
LQVVARNPSTIPIRIAPKPKCCKQSKNIFYDDCRFPGETNDFDNRLHNIDSGIILQQKKSPVPQFGVVDPAFHHDFDKALYGALLVKDLDVFYLDPSHAKQLIALIK